MKTNRKTRTTEPTRLRRGYGGQAEWVGGWSDDAAYIRALVNNLRAAGVRAKAADTSPYVGHLELKVAAEDLRKAKAVLRSMDLDYEAGCLGGPETTDNPATDRIRRHE
jgi:hypothetical protein